MRAVRIGTPGDLQLVDVADPVPGPGEVAVDVAYAGICGSDVEIFNGGRPSDLVTYPVIPGHEWSGVVSAVAEDVDPVLVGRKVVGEGARSCGRCRSCRSGEPMLCDTTYDEIGFTRAGGWAEQLVIEASQLHVLHDDADLRGAAGLEPAACAADIVLRAAVTPVDRVAVVGAGGIGALVVQMLERSASRELVVIDPHPDRGAVAPGDTDDLRGRFDVVIETAGVVSSPALCLDLVRRGGRTVLAGIPGPVAALCVRGLVAQRVEIRTVFGAPRRAWESAVDAFCSGSLDPGALVTHELDLADAREAIMLLRNRAEGVGKVLLRP